MNNDIFYAQHILQFLPIEIREVISKEKKATTTKTHFPLCNFTYKVLKCNKVLNVLVYYCCFYSSMSLNTHQVGSNYIIKKNTFKNYERCS